MGVRRGIPILLQNIDYGYSLEPPLQNRLDEAVLTSTHKLCFEQIFKKYQNFSSEYFHFYKLNKISVYCMGMFS